MSVGPLVVEVLLTFIVAAVVLCRYGNWYRHYLVVTVSVLVAWYFSMLIVFILPLDVSNVSLCWCCMMYNHTIVECILFSSCIQSSPCLCGLPLPLTPSIHNFILPPLLSSFFHIQYPYHWSLASSFPLVSPWLSL